MAHRTFFFFICTALLAVPMIAAGKSDDVYKSIFIDQGGRLHLVRVSGQDVLVQSQEEQVGFESPVLSSDGKTVGWLDLYPFPNFTGERDNSSPIPGVLTLYRNGHIILRFATDQAFWDWHFWRGGRDVAYSVGPTHGGAAQVLLRHVASGKVCASWVPGDGREPRWAKGLRY